MARPKRQIIYFGDDEDRFMEVRFMLETMLYVKIHRAGSEADALQLVESLPFLRLFIFEYPCWMDVKKMNTYGRVPVVMYGPKDYQENALCDHYVPNCTISWPLIFASKVKLAMERKNGPKKYLLSGVQSLDTNGTTIHQGLGAAS